MYSLFLKSQFLKISNEIQQHRFWPIILSKMSTILKKPLFPINPETLKKTILYFDTWLHTLLSIYLYLSRHLVLFISRLYSVN